MIRAIVSNKIQYGENPATYYEFAGLHEDDKPTDGVATGSLFLEVDTGDVFAYDETSSGTWNKIAELGGSGS